MENAKILSFIDAYREEKILWKMTLKDYNNKLKRRDVLIKLGTQFNMNLRQTKNKIKSLRSYFSKEQQKVIVSQKSGSGDLYISTWFAYNSLLFISDKNLPLPTMDTEECELMDREDDEHPNRHHSFEYNTYHDDKTSHPVRYAINDQQQAMGSNWPRLVSSHSHDGHIRNLVHFLTAELLPLSLVDSSSLAVLLRGLEPGFALPSAAHLIEHHMKPMLQRINADNTILFRDQPGICLTVDAVVDNDSQTYAVVSVNYVSKEWRKCSKLVSCCKIPFQTVECLLNVYEKVVASLEFADKITCVVYGSLQAPSIAQMNMNTEFKSIRDKDHLSAVEFNFAVNPFQPHIVLGCFSQLLQDTVKDVLMESKDFEQIISSVAMMGGGFQSEDSQASDSGFDEKRSFIHDTASLLGKIKSFREVATRTRSGTASSRATTSVDETKNFIELFEAYEDAFERLTRQGVTSSQVIPIIKGLRHHLQAQFKNATNSLPRCLLDSLNINFAHVEATEEYQMASYLDPRFKAAWCSDLEQIEIERYILTEVQRIVTIGAWLGGGRKQRELDTTRPKLFSFMSAVSARDEPDVFQRVKEEARRYTSSPCRRLDADPLTFWKEMESELPLLATLARRSLCLVTSMTSTEGIFGSIAGNPADLPAEQFELMMGLRTDTA